MEAIKERKFATMPSFVLGDESKVTYTNQNNFYELLKNYLKLNHQVDLNADILDFLKSKYLISQQIIVRLDLLKSIFNQSNIKLNQLDINIYDGMLEFNFGIDNISIEQLLDIQDQYFDRLADAIENKQKFFDNFVEFHVVIDLSIIETS